MIKKIFLDVLEFARKRKKIFIPLASFILLMTIAWIIYANFGPFFKSDIDGKKSLDVIIITDIHAGSGKKGHSENAIVHPSEFKENLKSVMSAKPDLVITLGDNVNDYKKCQPYADELKKLFKNYNVLWAKGNHDRDCFSNFSPQNYYYHDYDKAGWRIVMLDHDIDIDSQELAWLKTVLETDKKVLIATHVPFFSPSRDENTLLPQYVEVEKVISQAGNVKYVFMGHLHSRLWDKIYNGVHYFILPSVSGDEYPRYFKELTLD